MRHRLQGTPSTICHAAPLTAGGDRPYIAPVGSSPRPLSLLRLRKTAVNDPNDSSMRGRLRAGFRHRRWIAIASPPWLAGDRGTRKRRDRTWAICPRCASGESVNMPAREALGEEGDKDRTRRIPLRRACTSIRSSMRHPPCGLTRMALVLGPPLCVHLGGECANADHQAAPPQANCAYNAVASEASAAASVLARVRHEPRRAGRTRLCAP